MHLNKKIIYQILLIFFSTIIFYFLLGSKYASIFNIDWLSQGDLSTYQIGWNFFKSDQWRFPLGQNPHYGINIGSSIVYSDSLPLFAIFFKIFKTYLPSNFQYFSLWIFISIFLQLYFSFKIIQKKTNNYNYSLIGCIFFGLAPIFIHRIGLHLTLVGQWIILSGFYIELIDTKHKDLLRRLNILLSSTIHFYFTIILIIFFLIIKFELLVFKKKEIYPIIKDIFFTITALALLMYVIGYFEIGLDDSLGWGYGYYKFNLNSFFNPFGLNYFETFSWSSLIPPQTMPTQEHEGFSYLGLAGIIFFIIFLYSFFLEKNIFLFNKKLTLLIIVVFLPLAVSNNIAFGSTNIINIELNKFIYGFLSTIRASGRLIFPIYYLVLLSGIIFIYKYFKDSSKSIIVIAFLLLLQIYDLKPGLKNYYLGNAYKNHDAYFFKDEIWPEIPKKFNKLRTFYKANYTNLFHNFSEYLKTVDIIQTDIFHLGRVDRKRLALDRYELTSSLNNYKFPVDTVFISDNKNFVRHVKFLFKNKKKLNFYYRDGLWIISSKKIVENNIIEKKLINNLSPKILNYNSKIDLNFNNHDSYQGLGWSEEKENTGIWSDGFNSSILFAINKNECKDGSKLNFVGDIFKSKNGKALKIKLFINKAYVKEIALKKSINNNFSLNIDCKNNELFLIDFSVVNPLSEREMLSGLSMEKKGLLLQSIYLSN